MWHRNGIVSNGGMAVVGGGHVPLWLQTTRKAQKRAETELYRYTTRAIGRNWKNGEHGGKCGIFCVFDGKMGNSWPKPPKDALFVGGSHGSGGQFPFSRIPPTLARRWPTQPGAPEVCIPDTSVGYHTCLHIHMPLPHPVPLRPHPVPKDRIWALGTRNGALSIVIPRRVCLVPRPPAHPPHPMRLQGLGPTNASQDV